MGQQGAVCTRTAKERESWRTLVGRGGGGGGGPAVDRLVGLVVKASASGAEDPGFEPRLRWDFFGVE